MSFQAAPWDCDRTQVFNSLADFARRHRSLGITSARSLVFSCFNGAMPTAAGGKSGWLGKLARKLGPRVAIVSSGLRPATDWGAVTRALGDPDASLPVIGVSSDYWAEVDAQPQRMGGLEHALLMLAADKINATVFDCYLNRICASGKCRLPLPRSITPRQAVVELPMTRLIRYWEATNPPGFYFYLKREKYRMTSLRDFAGGAKGQ